MPYLDGGSRRVASVRTRRPAAESRPVRKRALAREATLSLAALSSAVLAVIVAVTTLPPPLSAQDVVVDQGTFLLSRNGEPVGTETFIIRRTGAGSDGNYVATGEVSLDLDGEERRMSVALEATTAGSVVSAYQLKEGDPRPTELYLTRSGSRFQARIVTPAGEQVREYRAAPGTVVLERYVTHHYYFTVIKLSGASIVLPALAPRSGEHLDLRLSDTGIERTQVAGQAVQARRIHIESGGIERDVWVDEQGRVLLAIDRDTGFRAERRDLPG